MQPHLALMCFVFGGFLPASARPEPRRRQQTDPGRCELPRSVSGVREGAGGGILSGGCAAFTKRGRSFWHWPAHKMTGVSPKNGPTLGIATVLEC